MWDEVRGWQAWKLDLSYRPVSKSRKSIISGWTFCPEPCALRRMPSTFHLPASRLFSERTCETGHRL